MNIDLELEKAFGHRAAPSQLVELRNPVTYEQKETHWFEGRHWREIKWQDWEQHSDAFYAFSPEAFVYFLPSILLAAAEKPEEWLEPAHALLGILDRSSNIHYWDAFITKRLIGLTTKEYEVLKSWILSLSGSNTYLDEDAIARCYETVELLERETKGLRNLLTAK